MNSIHTITIRRKPFGDPASGLIEFEGRSFPCLLGKNGVTTRKKEGDWKTPAGNFRLHFGYQRDSRWQRVATRLPLAIIQQNDGWCDTSGDRNYNRSVKLPYPASAETMYRDDHLYDLVIVLDYNFTRRVQGAGSAVFFHLTATKAYTAGCVAIAPALMRKILPRLSPKTVMRILP